MIAASVGGSGERRRWPALALRLLDLGTAPYPARIARRLKTLNVMAYLIVVFSTVYALIYAIEDFATYHWIVGINVALALVGLSVPWSHRIHELAGGLLIAISESLALFGLVAVLGRESGVQLNFVVGAAAPFVIFGLGRRAFVLATVAYSCALHIAAWFLFPAERALLSVDGDLHAQLYVSSALTAFGVIAALVYYAFHLVERAEAETEALLRKILPAAIVERLALRPGERVSDAFAEASILFSDIVGFVPLSRGLGAAATVDMLNDLMRGLDDLAARHGVERIKTIGDGYMAVAGVPRPAPDHARRLARMALEMAAVAREAGAPYGVPLRIRIGMACGPVQAGVIGARKLTYDVWGDAVNLAARLESTGEAERIQVSAAMRDRLAGEFDLACRGEIEIKGLGRQETWFLTGPRAPAAEPVAT